MIIVKFLALLIGQIAQNFQSTQVVWEFTSGNHWIEDINRSINRKHGRHFANYQINFTLHLERTFSLIHVTLEFRNQLTSLPDLYESMILRRINSRKFVQHGRIMGLRIIFESVWSPVTMTTWFCDSIIFNNVIMICLKSIALDLIVMNEINNNYLKFLIGSSQFPFLMQTIRFIRTCIMYSGSQLSIWANPMACFMISLSRIPSTSGNSDQKMIK